MNRYEQLDLFDLTESIVVTAKRIADGEIVNAEDKLDLAEQMWEARRRMPADREYGNWWRTTGLGYGWTWRAVLVKAGERITTIGRPGLQLLKTGGEFSIERFANTGDGWLTGEDESKPSANGSIGTDEYFTPRWIFDELDLTFDLDVASPPGGVAHIPATRFLTPVDDGLAQPWEGRVWMNPPYSAPTAWVERFVEHGNGIALLPFAKSDWFFNLWCSDEVTMVAPGIRASRFEGGQIQMATFLAAVGPTDVHDAVKRLGAAR